LLGQGQIFGEISLLDGGPRTAFIFPHSREVDLMVWSRDELLAQLQHDRLKAFEVCKLLGTRIRQQLGEVPVRPSRSLIARVLIDASRDGNKPVEMPWLAQQCGIWLKDLEVLITSWTEKKWVRSEGKESIQVLKPKSLEKVSSETY
jgi:hypothetical protein